MSLEAHNDSNLRCLVVQAGQYRCAIPVERVRRVVRALRVFPLPASRPELLGLAEFSGEPLAVLDLAQLVNAPPGAAPAFPVTVVAWAGPWAAREAVGLAADAALDVIEVAAGSWAEGTGGIVRGDIAAEGTVVRLVDLEAIGSNG